jgi:hypothetical protein
MKQQTVAACFKLLSQNCPVVLKESCVQRDSETRSAVSIVDASQMV